MHHVRAVLSEHLTAGQAAHTTATQGPLLPMQMRLFPLQLDVDISYLFILYTHLYVLYVCFV